MTYTPPRIPALLLGALVFFAYQVFRRPALGTYPHAGEPATMIAAIGFSIVVGYGLAMLGWLIYRTAGQVKETFFPSRGRIIGAVSLALVAPVTVVNGLPWIVAGLAAFAVQDTPFTVLGFVALATLICYPLAAMIIRHTYQRRGLRFALFALSFWAAYSGHWLWNGNLPF